MVYEFEWFQGDGVPTAQLSTTHAIHIRLIFGSTSFSVYISFHWRHEWMNESMNRCTTFEECLCHSYLPSFIHANAHFHRSIFHCCFEFYDTDYTLYSKFSSAPLIGRDIWINIGTLSLRNVFFFFFFFLRLFV